MTNLLGHTEAIRVISFFCFQQWATYESMTVHPRMSMRSSTRPPHHVLRFESLVAHVHDTDKMLKDCVVPKKMTRRKSAAGKSGNRRCYGELTKFE